MVNGRRTGVPSDTAFSSVDVPEDVEIKRIAASDLPRRWYDYPAPAALQRIGDAWARSNDTVAMLVPSAVVPIEYNALLNPKHPDFARLTIHPTERMRVDRRLTGGR